jgi:hypothetical protein
MYFIKVVLGAFSMCWRKPCNLSWIGVVFDALLVHNSLFSAIFGVILILIENFDIF